MSLWSIVDLQQKVREREIKAFKTDTCTDPTTHNQNIVAAPWKQ